MPDAFDYLMPGIATHERTNHGEAGISGSPGGVVVSQESNRGRGHGQWQPEREFF